MGALTPADERQYLQLLGLAGFASMASMRMCDPMLVVLGQEFQVTTGEASRVVSVFAVSYGLSQLVYGPLGDRFGKMRVISLATLGCSLGCLGSALATTLNELVLARMLAAACAAARRRGRRVRGSRPWRPGRRGAPPGALAAHVGRRGASAKVAFFAAKMRSAELAMLR